MARNPQRPKSSTSGKAAGKARAAPRKASRSRKSAPPPDEPVKLKRRLRASAERVAAAPKRPARIKKPRDYAGEYARRLENARKRAAAEGKPFSKQRARGHPEPKEHQLRLERAEQFRINYAAQQAARLPKGDAPGGYDRMLALVNDFVAQHGMAALRRMAAKRDELVAAHQANAQRKGAQGLHINLDEYAPEYEGFEELLYYH